MFFLGNLVKNLTTYHCKPTSNIDIYPSILEICINNLLKPFFFRSGPPPSSPDPARDHPTPLKIILLPNIFNKNQHIYLVNVYIIFPIKCIRFWHKIYIIFLKFVKIKNAVSCFITESLTGYLVPSPVTQANFQYGTRLVDVRCLHCFSLYMNLFLNKISFTALVHVQRK